MVLPTAHAPRTHPSCGCTHVPTHHVHHVVYTPHTVGDGMSWDTSDRRARLPRDWAVRVAKVKARDKRCMDKHHAHGCDGKAAEVDHIKQGDDHSLANLQALSVACHARKTRLDNGYRAKVKSPPEQHPGTR